MGKWKQIIDGAKGKHEISLTVGNLLTEFLDKSRPPRPPICTLICRVWSGPGQ